MYPCGWTTCPRGYLSFGTYSIMSIRKNNTEILAGTSPSIKRCHSVESTGTDSNRSVGAPQIVLRDIKNLSFIQSSDHPFWYKNASNFVKIKNCQVSLQNILMTPLRTTCDLFPNVQIRIAKRAIFLSLEIILKYQDW
jgi:hypothetical protein